MAADSEGMRGHEEDILQGWRPDARRIGRAGNWPTAPQAKGYGAPSPNCGLRFLTP